MQLYLSENKIFYLLNNGNTTNENYSHTSSLILYCNLKG
jgi:hypothetical protein